MEKVIPISSISNVKKTPPAYNVSFHCTLGTASLGVVRSCSHISPQPGQPGTNAFVPVTAEILNTFFASGRCEDNKNNCYLTRNQITRTGSTYFKNFKRVFAEPLGSSGP